MKVSQRIEAFHNLGIFLLEFLTQVSEMKDNAAETRGPDLLIKSRDSNPWFTIENQISAIHYWADQLNAPRLKSWLGNYPAFAEMDAGNKKIGVVNAGNIPLVAFHDFISVLLSGNFYLGKNATSDSFLLPFIAEQLMSIEPEFRNRIKFVEKLSDYDAVIATGSNNTARYFEYYFKHVPHLIRKNRNGIAALTGNESSEDLAALGHDIFDYFGLGCRSVSKLYVPAGYTFEVFFESIAGYDAIARHHKYMNNYEYNSTVYLLKKIPFLQNGFLNLKQDVSIASPVATLHYDFYSDPVSLREDLKNHFNEIQCIVTNAAIVLEDEQLRKSAVGFGKAQHPELWNYADGVDTMKFLLSL